MSNEVPITLRSHPGEALPKPKRRWTAVGIVAGAVLMTLPLLLFGINVFRMQAAFSTLGGSGIANPGELSRHIDAILLSTASGALLCFIGVVMFVVSLVFHFRNLSRANGKV